MASYTRIKICGFTSEAEARVTAEQGADAIGLVFYPPSPRSVSVGVARDIALSVGPFVTTTALFVNPTTAQVEEVLNTVGIHLLQFHGDESPEFCEQFQRPYIKALRIRVGNRTSTSPTPEQLQAAVTEEAMRYLGAQGILLDSYSEQAHGGTGEVFNWQAVPRNNEINWILAGGLNPGNVATAIESVQPYGVDVSSGVERSRGVKDPERIRQFIESVRTVTNTKHGKQAS